jgi:plasmid maintenance system antidote protein VapI
MKSNGLDKNNMCKIPVIVHPAREYIQEEMECRGWSDWDLAELLDWPYVDVCDMLNGRILITEDMSSELAVVFGVSPELFLSLDMRYQEWIAKRRDAGSNPLDPERLLS